MRVLLWSLLLSLLFPASAALAEVDPDCHEGKEAKSCLGSRLSDTRIADGVIGIVLNANGAWKPRYRVQYVRGDALDRLLVTLQPPDLTRGEPQGSERFERVAQLIAGELERLQAEPGGGYLGKILRHVEVVELRDGAGLQRVIYTVPCYEGFCATYRKADAEEAARLFGPMLEKAGWRSSLVVFRYRERDRFRDSDELELVLRAPRGAEVPAYAGAPREDYAAARDLVMDGVDKLPEEATERVLRGVGTLAYYLPGTSSSITLSRGSKPSKPMTEAEREELVKTLMQPFGASQSSAPSRAPEPTPPKDLSLDPKKLVVESSLPKEVTHATLRSSLGYVRVCHASAYGTRGDPPKGELTLDFDLRPDGLVERPRIADTSTLKDEEFSKCVLDFVRTRHFPPAGKSGGPVKVTYRFLE